MKITICAIGKERRGEYEAALARYTKQLPWPVEWRVGEVKNAASLPAAKRKRQEAELLLQLADGEAMSCAIALDERGKTPTSPEFAKQIENWQLAGNSQLIFFIGGADGLDNAVLSQCQYKLSFGRMVWPHQMIRPMLMEQLYRAYTILQGHPYHRD